MAEEQQDGVLIRFDSVDTLMFSARQLFDNTAAQGESIGFNLNMKMGMLDEPRSIVPIIIEVTANEPNVAEPLAKIAARSNFQITGIERFKSDEGYSIPGELLELLITNAYATTRGLLLARGAGTVVETLILPILSSAQLMGIFTGNQQGGEAPAPAPPPEIPTYEI